MNLLPELRAVPAHLATKTTLRRAHLVPTADPVAVYVYRIPTGGMGSAPLYRRDETRPFQEARAALKRRMADIHGQPSLF